MYSFLGFDEDHFTVLTGIICFVDNADSPSPRRGSFDEFIDSMGDAMDAEELRTALNDVASSSRKTTGKSGWTSSEEEADPMEEEDEGFFYINCCYLC